MRECRDRRHHIGLLALGRPARHVAERLAPKGHRLQQEPVTEILDGRIPSKMSRILPPGRRLGSYVIQTLIGSGGMGDVYRALDPRLNRQVAVKVLRAHVVSDPVILARFQREARTLAAISHPNIVVLHDIGEEDGCPYTVSELLVGDTLRDLLDRGPISWRQVLPMAREICDGLGAAHAKQVIHRDLKPENLMITEDGRLKILDFGLAFFQSLDAPTRPSRDSSETRPRTQSDTVPGTVVGTTGYMSPEQIGGEETDPRTDLFSLGCVLYELLTSRKPFYGKTMIETVAATIRDEPEPMLGSVEVVPPALSEIVLRCLAKDRHHRYPSAAHLLADLRAISEGASGSGPVALGSGSWETASGADLTFAPAANSDSSRRAIESIAVLPLKSASSRGSEQQESDYLSDGLTESLIRDLSRLDSARLLAWSTVMRYRDADPLRAARDLDVDAFLTGHVREESGRLRVSIELVHSPSGEHLWGDAFDRPLTQVFAIQQEISTAVSAHLRSHIATPTFSGPETSSTEAYRAYLRGRHFWNQRSKQGLQRSREHFRLALEHDPLYGRAWAGLADTYNIQPFWGLAPPTEAFPKAQEAAHRAIELCPNLAEAHAARAYAQFYFEWQWQDAESSYRTALEFDRNYATARHGYGVCSGLRSHFGRAFEQLHLAAELDPLSMIIAADTGLVHYWRGDLDAARSSCQSALALDEAFAPALLYLGLIEERDGHLEEATTILQRAVEASRGNTLTTTALGHVLAQSGRTVEAERILLGLTEAESDRYVSCYPVAVLLLGLGRVDEAFAWLDRAVTERSETLAWLTVDPRLDSIRGDRRLENLQTELAVGGR